MTSSFNENIPRIGFIDKWNYEEHFLSRLIIDQLPIEQRAIRIVTGYTLHSLARPRTFHQFAVTTDFCNLARRLRRCGEKSIVADYGVAEGQEKAQVHRNLRERVKKLFVRSWENPSLATDARLPESPGSR